MSVQNFPSAFGGVSDDLRYYEFELDSFNAYRSYTAQYSSEKWPVFSIGGKKPLQNIAAMKILEFQCMFSYYVFTQETGGFVLNEVGFPGIVVVIPEGNYNISTFLVALGAALTEASLLGLVKTYTATYDTTTSKITIYNNAAVSSVWSITFPPYWKGPAQWMGFLNDSTATSAAFLASGTNKGNTIVTPNAINLSGPNYLYVNSQMVGNLVDQHLPLGPNNSHNSGPQVAKIPINTNSGGTIDWVEKKKC